MTSPTPIGDTPAIRRGRAERWVTGATAGVAVTAVVATAATATVLAAATGAVSGTSAQPGLAGGAGGQQDQQLGQVPSQADGSQLGGRTDQGGSSLWQQWFGQGGSPGSGAGQGPSAGTNGS